MEEQVFFKKDVFAKLLKVQTKLKAPKSQYNSFGGFSYRNCEDILEAAKPILNEVKAVIILTDDVKFIENRFYIQATARFIDLDTGEEITNTGYAREEDAKKGMDGSQVTGAASSYARKYALNGLLAIDDNKDADTAKNFDKELLNEAAALNIQLENVAVYLKKSIEELTNEDLQKCVEQKKKQLEAQKKKAAGGAK